MTNAGDSHGLADDVSPLEVPPLPTQISLPPGGGRRGSFIGPHFQNRRPVTLHLCLLSPGAPGKPRIGFPAGPRR